jgi:hypothetical protein
MGQSIRVRTRLASAAPAEAEWRSKGASTASRAGAFTDGILDMQQVVGNQVVSRLVRELRETPPQQQSLSLQRLRSGGRPVPPSLEKNVDDNGGDGDGVVVENDGEAVGSEGAGVESGPVGNVQHADVDSFSVKWSKHASAGPTTVKLRLDYAAKFKKDADNDPANAEFRQNAMTKFAITAGPNKGLKGDTSPLHDDHYSRADDTAGNTSNDVSFVSNDNPGFAIDLDENDVVKYSFTAEQMVIDTSRSNAVIAKRGPHTATITGKGRRAYRGVPANLNG